MRLTDITGTLGELRPNTYSHEFLSSQVRYRIFLGCPELTIVIPEFFVN